MSEPNGPTSKDHNPTKHNEHEVTDPVTHLPLKIHDADTVELEQIPPPPTAAEEKRIRKERGADTARETNVQHAGMEDVVEELMHGKWWNDPIGDQRRTRIQTSVVSACAATLGAIGGLILWSLVGKLFGGGSTRLGWWFGFLIAPLACCLLGLGVGVATLALGVYQRKPGRPTIQDRSQNQGEQKQKRNDDCDDPPEYDGEHAEDHKQTLNRDESSPESAEWLNSLLHSIWPIVNPALFTSVADMLEDTMQSTLPKFVHGVRVADIGQGSEAVRILGVRWLDAGSAAQDVDGMKAEEGDFVNMEMAISYRAKETTTSGIKGRSQNAHLLVEFWVSGGIMVPVWVDMTGFLATARMRIQLTPNPPFLSIMTLTFLGLPKVTLKCTPLAKGFLNVMDVPIVSNWLQSSINMSVQEYVAPRSLTMDLKELLMGREKMDTDAVGVVIVTIRQAMDFRNGDVGKMTTSSEKRKGDAYVTVGWSKWGKPLWSTRIISYPNPVWEETTAVLVGPAELNSQEALQLQIWDSDRFTADDLLGEVELNLHDMMTNQNSRNCISIRHDNLQNEKGGHVPGTLHWECGYFQKTTFDQHLEKKHRSAAEVRNQIEREAENKLREAKSRDDQKDDGEVQQQKKEDMKEKSDEIISGSRPTADWPSGILSVKIEQISGLELVKVRESGVREDAEEDDSGHDLPSAYCTVIINQQRVYKTRTKMKSNNPFFNAGTEKFIRDWMNTDIIISVRDGRIHELDPVIGIVVLPLRELFKHSSQYIGSLPLVGGIGYGRMRLSLLFRSVQLKLPKRLLGWDVGTLEISPNVNPGSHLPHEFSSCRLVFQTLYGKAKMHPDSSGWIHRRGKPVRLPVKKRYASCLLIRLRKHAIGPDLTPAFATLWLKDIPDDEEVTLTIPVRRNNGDNLAKARANATMDIGEKIGEVVLKVRFWPGLSGYHKHMADHDKNMADVMEVLDYAEGEQEASKQLLNEEEEDYEGSDTSDSSSSSSEDEQGEGDSGPTEIVHEKLNEVDHGAVGQFKDFRKKKGELHRKHRGLLQWKAVRNVAWIGRGVEHQAERLSDKVKSTVTGKHRERETGMEKEYEM